MHALGMRGDVDDVGSTILSALNLQLDTVPQWGKHGMAIWPELRLKTPGWKVHLGRPLSVISCGR
jgi:hypothetical protein